MDNRENQPAPAARRPVTRNLLGAWLLSLVVGLGLMGSLVYFAGIWNILANTRLLDLLISAGVIRYHDVQQGIVDGVAQHKHFLASQDLIDYRLVLGVAVLYLAFWGFKIIQFHNVARTLGLKGGFREHARAWMYGEWYNRWLPYKFGDAATAAALEAQGSSLADAGDALFVQDCCVKFEIAFFALLGLILTGWTMWFGQLFWPVVMCLGFYLLVRGASAANVPAGVDLGARRKALLQTLANDPMLLVKLAVLSILAFLADDLAPYTAAMAFTSDNVILNVNFLVIQAGVVTGYIARYHRVSPGGIGQYEWGLALAVMMGGSALPEAATIALLDFAIRYATLIVVFVGFGLWRGIGASFRSSTILFNRTELSDEGPAV